MYYDERVEDPLPPWRLICLGRAREDGYDDVVALLTVGTATVIEVE